MPKAKAKAKKPRAKKQKGDGFMDFLGGVNKFLKDTKLISGLAGIASNVPMLAGIAAPVAGISGALGYGKKKAKPKKKKMCGCGLNQPGAGLKLAGRGLTQTNQRTPIR